jgi:tetratricopeptide (TPR) repeat protein
MEPTPEFEQQCSTIRQSWRKGEITYEKALSEMIALSEQAKASDEQANHARALSYLGTIYGYRGKYNQSIEVLQQSRKIFLDLNNMYHVAVADINLGECYRHTGQYHLAQRLFHQAYEVADSLSHDLMRLVSIVNEGLMLIEMKQMDSASRSFVRGLEISRSMEEQGSPVRIASTCEIHYGLAVISLDAGQLDKAWEYAQLAMTEAAQAEQPLLVGFANRIAGMVLAAFDTPPEDPNPHLDEAYRAFRKVEAEGELARTMYEHGKYLIATGQRIKAGRRLQQAMVIFAKLGMMAEAAKASEAQNAVF